MPVGTLEGIFLKILWARLSCIKFFRSLKVFIPKSLSLSWDKRDTNTKTMVPMTSGCGGVLLSRRREVCYLVVVEVQQGQVLHVAEGP